MYDDNSRNQVLDTDQTVAGNIHNKADGYINLKKGVTFPHAGTPRYAPLSWRRRRRWRGSTRAELSVAFRSLLSSLETLFNPSRVSLTASRA